MQFFLKMEMNYVIYKNLIYIISVSFVSKIILLDYRVFIVNSAERFVNSRGNQVEIRIRVGCT